MTEQTIPPHLKCSKGDEAFVRITILETCSDAFQVRVEDYPSFISTHWVPSSEVAKAEDIASLRPINRSDLKSRDPAYSGVNTQKLPK